MAQLICGCPFIPYLRSSAWRDREPNLPPSQRTLPLGRLPCSFYCFMSLKASASRITKDAHKSQLLWLFLMQITNNRPVDTVTVHAFAMPASVRRTLAISASAKYHSLLHCPVTTNQFVKTKENYERLLVVRCIKRWRKISAAACIQLNSSAARLHYDVNRPLACHQGFVAKLGTWPPWQIRGDGPLQTFSIRGYMLVENLVVFVALTKHCTRFFHRVCFLFQNSRCLRFCLAWRPMIVVYDPFRRYFRVQVAFMSWINSLSAVRAYVPG